MKINAKLSLLVSTFILLAFCKANAQQFPGDTGWSYDKHPANNGWDTSKLKQLRKFIIDSTRITGFMIIQHGKIVYDYGDTREVSYIASCRKSVLAMLYGVHVKSGEIKLEETLSDLHINDVGGLLATEKEAKVRDLISARSGVYHQAGYLGDDLAYAPKRGSVKPGQYWLYSNWDFNVAGYIFEKQTHTNIYDEVERQLAIPLHMQDWQRSLQHKEGDTTRSSYLAYPMWFSTRDMARIGLLMLNKGKWNNQQLIPADWVSEMIKPKTDWTEVNKDSPDFRNTGYYFGYGYLWWLWQNVKDPRLAGAYSALGAWTQTISVFPAIDAVVVYKTKDIYERETPFIARFRLLSLAVQAFKK